jgi:hypothetical protein
MEGSHSPFGFIWQVASETGWSIRHILWKAPYALLLLMMSDTPHYLRGEELEKKTERFKRFKRKKPEELTTLDYENFYQTRLNG